jgi:hypothetical protein
VICDLGARSVPVSRDTHRAAQRVHADVVLVSVALGRDRGDGSHGEVGTQGRRAT